VRGQAGPSLIGPGLRIVGRLDCAGDLQIDGIVEGDVHGHGVRIGNAAIVKGTVVGEIVQLAGTIEGNIDAESVLLARSARLFGDISYQSLQIEAGAHFSGNCRRSAKTAPQAVVLTDSGASKGCYVAPTPALSVPEVEDANRTSAVA
jgi:cytoskeletal protein CcmA (bactofilin family)